MSRIIQQLSNGKERVTVHSLQRDHPGFVRIIRTPLGFNPLKPGFTKEYTMFDTLREDGEVYCRNLVAQGWLPA